MSTGGQPAGGDQGGSQQSGQPQGVPWAGVAEGKTWEVGGKPWYEATIAEPEVRDAIKAKNYAHPGVLAKSYAELERTVASRDDSKMIRVPDENASPQDWDAVFTKLGRPASPEGYKDVKWGENADPRMVKFASDLAFKLGLPPKVAEHVMAKEWNAFAAQLASDRSATVTAEGQAAEQALRAEWKGNFDEHRARGLRVMQALNKQGFSDEDMQAIEKQVGILPVVKLLATIGKLTGEGNFLEPQASGGQADPANMTQEQAKAEVNKLMADDKFQKTYTGVNEPGHKEAVERMEALYKKVGGMVTPL